MSNMIYCFFFFKQKTAYEMRISDWSSDVCSSDLEPLLASNALAARSAADRLAALKRQRPAGARHSFRCRDSIARNLHQDPRAERYPILSSFPSTCGMCQIRARLPRLNILRSEALSVGKEGVSRVRSRGSREHKKKKH